MGWLRRRQRRPKYFSYVVVTDSADVARWLSGRCNLPVEYRPRGVRL